jgi:D-tyrosyl-tRNA(Tyr) deacylase
MRAVVQRVNSASVKVERKTIGKIETGLLILLGVEDADTVEDLDWLAGKIARLRIFGDEVGAMNKSLIDIKGNALVVSQFTLFASTKKGNRPSFKKSGEPVFAKKMYEKFIGVLGELINKRVQTGEFGAKMQVELLNDGPVTIVFDTNKKD